MLVKMSDTLKRTLICSPPIYPCAEVCAGQARPLVLKDLQQMCCNTWSWCHFVPVWTKFLFGNSCSTRSLLQSKQQVWECSTELFNQDSNHWVKWDGYWQSIQTVCWWMGRVQWIAEDNRLVEWADGEVVEQKCKNQSDFFFQDKRGCRGVPMALRSKARFMLNQGNIGNKKLFKNDECMLHTASLIYIWTT